MREIAIVGAGELGGTIAHMLARHAAADVVRLIDDSGRVAEGKALDILQSSPIEQFCANGVTGTIVTLSGCMGGFSREEEDPSYREAALFREGLERGFGPRAQMLDHLGRSQRP